MTREARRSAWAGDRDHLLGLVDRVGERLGDLFELSDVISYARIIAVLDEAKRLSRSRNDSPSL